MSYCISGTSPVDYLRLCMRYRALLLSLCLCLFTLAQPSAAQAQRAECYGQQDAPRWRNATTDFPGLFDANLAAKGTVVAYLPTFSVYWGVTENLTLGTNLLYVGIPLALHGAGGLLEARYRFYATPTVQTTIDGMVGLLRMDLDHGESARNWLVLTRANAAFALSKSHELTVSALAGNLGLSITGGSDAGDAALTGVGVGLGYAWTPLRWFAAHAFVLVTPVATGVADLPSEHADINVAASTSVFQRMFYRAFLSFRAGDHWLFELGLVGVGRNVLPAPWITIGFRIG